MHAGLTVLRVTLKKSVRWEAEVLVPGMSWNWTRFRSTDVLLVVSDLFATVLADVLQSNACLLLGCRLPDRIPILSI